jgi:hypothetical protein
MSAPRWLTTPKEIIDQQKAASNISGDCRDGDNILANLWRGRSAIEMTAPIRRRPATHRQIALFLD